MKRPLWLFLLFAHSRRVQLWRVGEASLEDGDMMEAVDELKTRLRSRMMRPQPGFAEMGSLESRSIRGVQDLQAARGVQAGHAVHGGHGVHGYRRAAKRDQRHPSSARMDRRQIDRLLDKYPIIDGHNDFPMSLREILQGDLDKLRFNTDLTKDQYYSNYSFNHSDLPKFRKGKYGAQFWAAYFSCSTQFKNAAQLFMEQIELIKRFISKYKYNLEFAGSTADIQRAIKSGKIASLIGVESGHAIESSLSMLRVLYDMGVRYMTLSHTCNTPWADSSQVDAGEIQPRVNGLSDFGKRVILEMNRIGMMVDISHVSAEAMRKAIQVSKAPVIFSHSGVRAVCNHSRNVPDDVLRMVKKKGGIVMINYYSCYLTDECEKREATIDDVVKHIKHIRRVAGIDHVGLGSDFNGVPKLPVGLGDVSKIPKIFYALAEDTEFNWSLTDFAKISNLNLMNVFRQVERTARKMQIQGYKVDNNYIPLSDLGPDTQCSLPESKVFKPT